MEDANEFIEHYRSILLSYLDAKNNDSSGEPGPLEFIDEVINSWCKLSAGRILEEPSPQERTFWFALYQLEELVEHPAMENLDPYEGILMQNLVEVRELLRDGGILPEVFFATRPGEDPGAF